MANRPPPPCEVCDQPLPPPRPHGGAVTRCPSTYQDRGPGRTALRVYSLCEQVANAVSKAEALVGQIDDPVVLDWFARELNRIRMRMARRATALREARETTGSRSEAGSE